MDKTGSKELLYQEWSWVIEIVVGLLILLAVTFFLRHIVRILKRKKAGKRTDLRENLDKIIFLPLNVGLWTIGIVYVLDTLAVHLNLKIIPNYLNPLRNALLIVCLTWMVLRWIKVARMHFSSRLRQMGVDQGTIHSFSKLTTFFIVLVAVLLILQILGLNIVPLLAFGGIGAAVLAFAAKDFISNFLGGIMLHINRPFMIGDTILLHQQNQLIAQVEEIGWYSTSLRDQEKRPVYLPNSFISSSIIINISRMTHRKMQETISIRSEDFSKILPIVEKINQILQQHTHLDHHLPAIAALKSYGASSLDLLIECYILETRYEEFLKVKQELLISAQQIIEAEGAEISTPTSFIHVKEFPGKTD